MIYSIFRKSIPSQFIQVHLSLRCSENETIHLQLPAWRPGRYELANSYL
ncbi:M61 family metallopeptidase [Aquiflexum balticum]